MLRDARASSTTHMPMPASFPLPFARYAGVYIRDIDEAIALYSRSVTSVRLTRTARFCPFAWRAHELVLGPLVLSSAEAAGGAAIESDDPVRDYHVSIPIGEARGQATGTRDVYAMVSGQSAFVSSPDQVAKVVLQPGFRSVALRIPASSIVDAMATLTGTPRPVRFERTLALDAARTAPFRRLLRELVAAADHEPAAFAAAGAAAQITEALLIRLLLCHPHSEGGRLSVTVPTAEPRHVRRAAAYLEAHLARPITMAELVHETGVSARSLQLGFQRSRGCSPLSFLQSRRLQRARVLLLGDDSLASVGQAAQLAGFQHMGRFSAQYRQRFGETPASTRAAVAGTSRRGTHLGRSCSKARIALPDR